MADATIRATYQTVNGRSEVYSSPALGQIRRLRAFAAEPVDGVVTLDMLAPSPGTASPLGILILDYRHFGLWVKCAGASPNVTLRLLLAPDDGAASYAVPETGGSVMTVIDANPHAVAVTPVLMPYLRLRVVGNAGNGPDTTVTADLILAGEA